MRLQLNTGPGVPPLRATLQAAACMLLAAGLPAAARAGANGTTQIDLSTLLYGEQARVNVLEPVARITRIFPNGQSISAQLGIDVISGASPSGATPSGVAQTTTSASGRARTVSPDQIPVTDFQDVRASLDVDWKKPFGIFTPALGGHFSREKDYQSLGGSVTLSTDLMQKLTTVTVGAGMNRDNIFPVNGIATGLSEPPETGGEEPDKTAESENRAGQDSRPKTVTNAMVGVSRVLTRRWIVGANVTQTFEDGYLTEPYKLVSVLNASTGRTATLLTENRPTKRHRTALLGSTVYHLSSDVLYASYRFYRDDWDVGSNTVDLKLRHELEDDRFFMPHVRYYKQTAADFFLSNLVEGRPLPEFATSDYRLGPLQTLTVGGTYGFHFLDYPGEWTVRAEYMAQIGAHHPVEATGIQRDFDLYPVQNIGSIVVGYSIAF